jgi:hypothetical protein
MVPFVERRYVFTGNGVFMCKTNVGEHRDDNSSRGGPYATSMCVVSDLE